MSLLLLWSSQRARIRQWSLGADEVLLMDRGGLNPRKIIVAQAACSWELSAAGQFSAFATLNDLVEAGIPWDMKGMWIEWESPAGRWGGVVTGRPITDGVAEIAAMSYAALLRGRVVEQNVRPVSATPGAHVRRLLQEAQRETPHFIVPGIIDEGGQSIAISYGGQDAYNEILPAITGAGGCEWIVTEDRVLNFTRYAGEDRSNEVRLVEGRHIGTYRVADDLWLMANNLVGMSASPEMESKDYTAYWQKVTVVPATYSWKWVMRQGKRKRIRVISRKAYLKRDWIPYETVLRSVDPFVAFGVAGTGSIERYGELDAVRVYDDTRDMGTIATRLRAELGKLLDPVIGMELTIVDVDGVYRRFDAGDVIWVDIGSARIAGAFRVINKAFDGGGIRIAGDMRPVRVYDD